MEEFYCGRVLFANLWLDTVAGESHQILSIPLYRHAQPFLKVN